MEKEFVPYQEALALKELGCIFVNYGQYWRDRKDHQIFLFTGEDMSTDFDAPGNSDIEFMCDAPLYQQAFRWFRERYMIKGYVSHAESMGGYKVSIQKWNYDNNIGKWERLSPLGTFTSYEEAELECLKKLIYIVKNSNMLDSDSQVVITH